MIQKELSITLVENEKKHSFELNINGDMTLEALKAQIQYETGIPLNRQIITFNNKTLYDAKSSMKNLGISKGSTLYLNRMEGKGGPGGPGGPGASFCNLANQKVYGVITSSVVTPRTIEPGMMMETKCLNSKCTAYKKNILIRKGFGDGEFNVIEQMYECICHMCNQPAPDAFNIGFYMAKVELKGKSQTKGKVMMNIIADNQKEYKTFECEGKVQQLDKWNYLSLKISPIK